MPRSIRPTTLALLAVLFISPPALAHFLWIKAEPRGEGALGVEAGFGEPLDVDASLADNIEQAEYFVRAADGKETPLVMSLDRSAGVYHAKVDHALPAAAIGVCEYGVVKLGRDPSPSLLRYFAKHLAGSPADWPRLAGSKRLTIEIDAAVAGAGFEFVVLADGKPLDGAEIKLTGPKSKRAVHKTNGNGLVRVPAEGPGEYALFVGRELAAVGSAGGKAYEKIKEYATLSFEVSQGDLARAGGESSEGLANRLPRLPDAITAFGAAVLDGSIYVYSGHTGKTHVHSTENLSKHFSRWRIEGGAAFEPLPMRTPLQSSSLVAHGGRLYRVGGMLALNPPGEAEDMRSVAECERYFPAKREWSPLPSMPEERSSHDAVVVGDRLVVIGGWKLVGDGEEKWHDTALSLDLADASPAWKTLPQPFQRRALAAAELEGKVYVLGGFTPDSVPSLEVDVLDPWTGEWSKGPSLPEPKRNGFACSGCNLGGRLYVTAMDGNVYRLSADKSKWEGIGRVQVPRFQHRMLPAAGKLVLLGGSSSKEHLDSIEWIDVSGSSGEISRR